MKTIKKLVKLTLLVIAILIFNNTYSQISSGGIPYSFRNNNISPDIPMVIMQPIDIKSLKDKDLFDDEKGRPYRFGIDLDVNLGLGNAGQWEVLPNGDRLWRLAIISDGAYSINLIFSRYRLPEGASLFVYSEDQSHTIGAFTARNNKSHGKFSTTVVKGESIVLEYYEPKEVSFSGQITISKVIHAYRNTFFKNSKMGFGDSGSCNNNVNCPESAGWENQINASLLYLLSNNTRICSGSILNNENQDGTPYFLSADHCFSSDYATWIFMFNYQSPNCTNIDGPTNETVSGSTLKAKRSDSDFMLLEISSSPPPQYNVYYAGWSNADTAATSAVGIHHPSNDIKKISFDTNAVVSAAWGSSPDTHWKVEDWDDGTTEPGSSGSPLFDHNHRVIGQLSGGGAACGNDLEDLYGKIAHSWNGTSASERLKDWLDPNSTGVNYIDGANFNTPNFNLDAVANNISGIEAYGCDSIFTPEVFIRNIGADTLTSATILYGLAGSSLTSQAWTGTLGYTQSSLIILPTLTLSAGNYTYVVVIDNPNNSTDQNPANDTATFDFSIIDGRTLTINIIADDYPEETSFEIMDSLGNSLYSESSFAGATLNSFNYCLETGCYTFVIHDSYGDGICCGWGNGSYDVVLPDSTIAGSGGTFTFTDTVHFCIYDQGPVPIAAFTGNPLNVCTGESVNFSDMSTENPTSWQWNFPGGTPSSSNNQNPTVTYNNPGTFDVLLTSYNSNGPGYGTIANYINVTESPSISLISTDVTNPGGNDGSIDVNISGGTPPYSLYWSNGTTSSSIVDLSAGDYFVTVTDSNGCSVIDSITINEPVVGINEVTSLNFEIIPNPAKNQINIVTKETGNDNKKIIIYNSIGKEILQLNTTENNFRIDTHEFLYGLYYIKLIKVNGTSIKKLLIL